MKKVKKIKIRANGKTKFIPENYKMSDLIKFLDVRLKKVAIELNGEIIEKKKIKKINLKNNDKIEIVHFIGGG
ncbi:MAG: thiamine biosynthesis protein ThiS [Pelagibacterales bacterium MED-G42]|nr:MAG: thiamine biosynthesis protein ThiS [Pelagibacterales bacterium MED-G42]